MQASKFSNKTRTVVLDVDVPVCRKPCSKPAVERILEFGRELYSMSQRLKLEHSSAESNEKMLEVSTVFYSDHLDFIEDFIKEIF